MPNQPFASVVVRATLSAAMDIDWHIGDVIAKLRKRRRMNQTMLAAKVGVNKATIVRAEDGDPKVSRATYMNIARVLGIDLASLEVEAARLSPDANGQSDVSGARTRTVAPSGTLPGHHAKHRLVAEAPNHAAQKKGRRSRG